MKRSLLAAAVLALAASSANAFTLRTYTLYDTSFIPVLKLWAEIPDQGRLEKYYFGLDGNIPTVDEQDLIVFGDADIHDAVLSLRVGATHVKPQAVPIPAAAWLFGSAVSVMGGMGFAHRRRARSATKVV